MQPINASDIEAEWAVLNWVRANEYRCWSELLLSKNSGDGASSWNIVTPANGGTDNFKLKGQLIPGATYNFETRTWCNTGDANNPTDPTISRTGVEVHHLRQCLVQYRPLTYILLM